MLRFSMAVEALKLNFLELQTCSPLTRILMLNSLPAAVSTKTSRT